MKKSVCMFLLITCILTLRANILSNGKEIIRFKSGYFNYVRAGLCDKRTGIVPIAFNYSLSAYYPESVASNPLTVLTSLKIDGITPVYDSRNQQLMLTVSKKYCDEVHFSARIVYSSTAQYKLVIEGKNIYTGGIYDFGILRGGHTWTVSVCSGSDTIAKARMVMTFLPIALIEGSNFTTSTFRAGKFRLIDADYRGNDSVYAAGFRYRGASNSGKQKKSYAIKLTDAAGQPIDRSYHGLRTDNYWILDAMAIDKARMRNSVSFGLWNKFASPSYYKSREPNAQKGSRCFFVEVLFNGSYAGLYNMMEKSDREQFKIKKLETAANGQETVRGILCKASTWSYACQYGYNGASLTGASPASYNNSSEVWDGWEFKYPDMEENQKIDWATMYNAINFVATSSVPLFKNQVASYFDLPVLMDYYLMIDMIFAFDNRGKNTYLMAYNTQEDKKLTIAPWDMDGTWGRNWNSNTTSPKANMRTDYMNNGLFLKLFNTNYQIWTEGLKDRYRELRETYFLEDSLLAPFQHNFELFARCGCDARETARWSGSDGIVLDFSTEPAYIKDWVHQRLAFLDGVYGYDPSAISRTASEQESFGTKLGAIVVHSESPRIIRIYDLSGRLVATERVEAGIHTISVTPGIYIVNKKELLVK